MTLSILFSTALPERVPITAQPLAVSRAVDIELMTSIDGGYTRALINAEDQFGHVPKLNMPLGTNALPEDADVRIYKGARLVWEGYVEDVIYRGAAISQIVCSGYAEMLNDAPFDSSVGTSMRSRDILTMAIDQVAPMLKVAQDSFG
jgi:hypothetical protein